MSQTRAFEPDAMPQCDVVMKGGITSGVVYPRALTEFSRHYRLRSLGGASAGAIGAALGAAAEFGRAGGGFDRLDAIPGTLSDGRLAALFQAQPSTEPLLGVLLTATGHDAPGAAKQGAARLLAVGGALLRGYPVRALVGGLPGLALIVAALASGRLGLGIAFVLAGLVILVLGVAIGVAGGVWRTVGRDVPDNLFGICTGLSTGRGPGFTDWLSDQIDQLAGPGRGTGPLLYGHLWTGSDEARPVPIADRRIDLRMVSTCLTQARPYEMPWDTRVFFYEPAAWRRLFPAHVMDALAAAAPARPEVAGEEQAWSEEDAAAAAHPRHLRRLPEPHLLPVIVSVRMSLSFPLLISAVPLWTIRRGGEQTETPEFRRVWFTDGGFCSNFPVHLFDAPLPTRPTFCIDLGGFADGAEPSTDQRQNLRWARDNRAVQPTHRTIEDSGFGALASFFSAALATSREWADASQLGTPGMRDRVVRVLQSGSEGGLNLFMDTRTIEGLAERGRVAAEVMVEKFTTKTFGEATGWDNHRWVRYRAMLETLPRFLSGYALGRGAMGDLDPTDPPSYPLRSSEQRRLAADLDAALVRAAALVDDPERARAKADMMSAPRPSTVMRRVPIL